MYVPQMKSLTNYGNPPGFPFAQGNSSLLLKGLRLLFIKTHLEVVNFAMRSGLKMICPAT